jgi:hypothetical protein
MNRVDSYREQIIYEFSKVWELNDAAHRIEHFLEVEKCANHINKKLGLKFSPKLILMVAFFHDMFAWSRHNHHQMSAEWILTTDLPMICVLKPGERELVAAGCREHRASGTEPFSCDFAELMCSADRGFPTTDVETILQRAIQYRLALGYGEKDARQGAIEHVKEKFGTDGYARYPEMYQQAFDYELALQRELVDKL